MKYIKYKYQFFLETYCIIVGQYCEYTVLPNNNEVNLAKWILQNMGPLKLN